MIDFTGICKSYGKQDIFNNVSFRINAGERVGIVGPNGMGKTTMFQILTGEISPDKGEVVIPKKARLGYLRQQLDYYDPEEKLIDFVCAAEGELKEIVQRIHELETKIAAHSDSPSDLNTLGHLQSAFEAQGGYDLKHKAAAALAGLGFRENDLERKIQESLLTYQVYHFVV